MKFTCLIPAYSNGATIRLAIESVLAQTVQDVELFVVCDGAPPETHAIADEFAARDARVRVFKFEKGERHGEAWRHRALEQASGEAVCYLSDDDCWFPDHLETMAPLLAEADFAHTRHTEFKPSFEVVALPPALVLENIRQRMLTEPFNIFGPTSAGHRLDAYRRLPEGWAPGPKDVWSDLNMWRKWIAADGMRFASSPAITTFHVRRGARRAGVEEADFWRLLFLEPTMRQALRELIPPQANPISLSALVRRAAELHQECELHRREASQQAAELTAELARVQATRTWRYTLPLRQVWRRIRDAAGLDAAPRA